MIKFFNKIESLLLKLVIISLLLLIAVQFFNNKYEDTIFTSKYSNEKSIPLQEIKDIEKGVIILEIEDNNNSIHKNVEILINGECVEKFDKNNEIKINVYDNDLVEIDGTKYLDEINVKVVGISKNIQYPKLNTTVTTSQSIEILSKITLK